MNTDKHQTLSSIAAFSVDLDGQKCVLGEAEACSSTSLSHLSLEHFRLLPAFGGSGFAETVEIWLMSLFPHPVQPVFRKITLNNNSVGWISRK